MWMAAPGPAGNRAWQYGQDWKWPGRETRQRGQGFMGWCSCSEQVAAPNRYRGGCAWLFSQ